MDLVAKDEIDYEHIQKLINRVDVSSIEGLRNSCDRISKLVSESTNDTVRYKRELIKKFLDKLVVQYENRATPMTNQEVINFYETFLTEEKSDEIAKLSNEVNVSAYNIRSLLDKQDKVKPSDIMKAINDGNETKTSIEKNKLRKTLANRLINIGRIFLGTFTKK